MFYLKSKEMKNAFWLIGSKVIQMLLTFAINILSARYLGPSNFGLINYAGAYVSFFSSFCVLGINSIIIKELTDNPEDEGKLLGTAIGLRFLATVFSIVMIIGIVMLIDSGETTTVVTVILCSILLLFQIFNTFDYWFHYRYKSKNVAIVSFIAYIITTIYKVFLLITGKNVYWFAISTSLDALILYSILLVLYFKSGGKKLEFSKESARTMLKKSYHFIISSMMVAVYGQTDKIMLKHMLSEADVGYYSVALTICLCWTFVLQAIIDTFYPTITRLFKEDEKKFLKKNRQLYCIVFYASVFVSIMMVLFGSIAIRLLYGVEYLPAATPLSIITWYVAFSYLGVARNAWLVCTNNQRMLKYIYLLAAITNVGLNFALIPIIGVAGAALASLITQVFTSIVLPSLFLKLRPNTKIMIDAILLKDVFDNNRTNTIENPEDKNGTI